MTRTLLSIACHAYAVAGVAYLIFLVRQKGYSHLVGSLSLVAGFLCHGAMIVARANAMDITPVTNMAEGFSFMAWLMVGTYLILDWIYRLPAIGAFVTPLALTITVSALLVPGRLDDQPVALGLPGLLAHVTVAFLGMAFFAVAAGVAVMYLLQERQLKGKKFGFVFSRLPSLQILDEINRRLVLWGFVLLSVTIASGAFFAKARWGQYWSWDPKETLSLVAWAIFAGLIQARLLAGWRGRRVAMLTMAGFAILIGSFVGLFTFPMGQHGSLLTTDRQGRPPAPAGRPHGG
jgi:cytochrome c-type biogenesis protein CcsB